CIRERELVAHLRLDEIPVGVARMAFLALQLDAVRVDSDSERAVIELDALALASALEASGGPIDDEAERTAGLLAWAYSAPPALADDGAALLSARSGVSTRE